MDETSALIEAILREQEEEEEAYRRRNHTAQNTTAKDNEWQTVSYQKRKRNKSSSKKPLADDNSAGDPSSDVFRSVQQHSEERRLRLLESQIAAATSVDAAPSRSKRHSDDEDDIDAQPEAGAIQNGSSEVKKVKQKKPKKPKVTVAEAASRINADDLTAFLAEITASYDSQQDIQLMRFADYFGRVFSSVSGAQFPWLKTFKESTVARIVDIPLSHISEDIYKISTDWIAHLSSEALGSFVLWSLDSILEDFSSHQGVVKGFKKSVQQSSSKSQVAIFVVLAMVLRRKPDVMISLVPIMKESQKYQAQDKLPVTIWVVAQASQGDLVMGLYLWVSLLLPILSGKFGCNPQSRDMILQLVERIITFPKARPILLNGAVRKGERVVPPWALDSLLRVTFPVPSARVKATERFEAVYPTLKEVALVGTPGSKAIKLLAQQILSYVIKAAGEANPDLSKEASDIFIWCLTQNPECYKHWDLLYMDNLKASIAVLKKLSDDWKEHCVKHPTLDPLRETLKRFIQKNEKALAKVDDGARHTLLKDADKYCKVILGRLSRGHGCMKSMAIISVVLAVGAVFMSQNMHLWDYNKLTEMLNLF
ncbi:transmembrane protein 214-A-like [Abrus precatorius]|uniref:Transmembrane protein 214-A-like n=1 Tax=Abrus precatorius TaxID=3816 RepID=A0A8B8JIT3_ABRPR|nr:transmembrane protein 214-A-like [Abrus precatorius]